MDNAIGDVKVSLHAFSDRVDAWIDANRLAGLPQEGDVWGPISDPAMQQWVSRVRSRGWICPGWPLMYGGGGLDLGRQAILDERFALAGVPRPKLGFGESLVGPALFAHGTDEQRARLLPRIINLQDFYCQGFSEPDAGSDLAGVRTRGYIDGEGIRIVGQKIWTSEAADANLCFVLCRTDPDASKHRGLSFAIVPMLDNRVEVRPILQIDGRSDYCEVFFDGSRVEDSNVIGGLGNGWEVTRTTLTAERSMGHAYRHFEFMQEFDSVWEQLMFDKRLNDVGVIQELVKAYTQIELVRAVGLGVVDHIMDGRDYQAENMMYKLLWSEAHRSIAWRYQNALGGRTVFRGEAAAYELPIWHQALFMSQAETIYAGTSEIQRDIIAERGLDLPREPR